MFIRLSNTIIRYKNEANAAFVAAACTADDVASTYTVAALGMRL